MMHSDTLSLSGDAEKIEDQRDDRFMRWKPKGYNIFYDNINGSWGNKIITYTMSIGLEQTPAIKKVQFKDFYIAALRNFVGDKNIKMISTLTEEDLRRLDTLWPNASPFKFIASKELIAIILHLRDTFLLDMLFFSGNEEGANKANINLMMNELIVRSHDYQYSDLLLSSINKMIIKLLPHEDVLNLIRDTIYHGNYKMFLILIKNLKEDKECLALFEYALYEVELSNKHIDHNKNIVNYFLEKFPNFIKATNDLENHPLFKMYRARGKLRSELRQAKSAAILQKSSKEDCINFLVYIIRQRPMYEHLQKLLLNKLGYDDLITVAEETGFNPRVKNSKTLYEKLKSLAKPVDYIHFAMRQSQFCPNNPMLYELSADWTIDKIEDIQFLNERGMELYNAAKKAKEVDDFLLTQIQYHFRNNNIRIDIASESITTLASSDTNQPETATKPPASQLVANDKEKAEEDRTAILSSLSPLLKEIDNLETAKTFLRLIDESKKVRSAANVPSSSSLGIFCRKRKLPEAKGKLSTNVNSQVTSESHKSNRNS